MNQKKEKDETNGYRNTNGKESDDEVAECQSSGMRVSAWCELHGIKVKTYYYHLRRVRESLLTESCVVPLSTKSISDNIEIFSGDVRITLPCGCPEETLSTILKVLKNAQ